MKLIYLRFRSVEEEEGGQNELPSPDIQWPRVCALCVLACVNETTAFAIIESYVLDFNLLLTLWMFVSWCVSFVHFFSSLSGALFRCGIVVWSLLSTSVCECVRALSIE